VLPVSRYGAGCDDAKDASVSPVGVGQPMGLPLGRTTSGLSGELVAPGSWSAKGGAGGPGRSSREVTQPLWPPYTATGQDGCAGGRVGTDGGARREL
jgi:hypothetical protein